MVLRLPVAALLLAGVRRIDEMQAGPDGGVPAAGAIDLEPLARRDRRAGALDDLRAIVRRDAAGRRARPCLPTPS